MKIITHELPKYTDIEIYPVGDLHIGDKHHDKERVKELIEEIKEQENRYIILNGDIINNATKHSVSDSYSEVLTPNEQIDETVWLFESLKDRILCITEGNHEERSYRNDGIKIMYQVAQRLDIVKRYSEGAYLLFISFGKSQGRDNRKMIYSIYGKHGAGGGRRPGAKMNRLEDMMMIVDADIYIHGHTHLPAVMRKSFFRCDYRNRKITEVDKLFVNTNAFLKYGGYGESKGYTPMSTRYPKIILDGVYRQSKALL